jgi:hypothetical protein
MILINEEWAVVDSGRSRVFDFVHSNVEQHVNML